MIGEKSQPCLELKDLHKFKDNYRLRLTFSGKNLDLNVRTKRRSFNEIGKRYGRNFDLSRSYDFWNNLI